MMGPIDHGIGQSIYLAGPEKMMLEFSTIEVKAGEEETCIEPYAMSDGEIFARMSETTPTKERAPKGDTRAAN